MKHRLLTLALAGLTGASVLVPAIAGASTSPVVYDSTPTTVTVPSLGPEAYSFNRIGGEAILRPHHSPIRHVSVTMVSWACQSGGWDTGCSTTPGATFPASINLRLYRSAHVDPDTGVTTPGKRIASITRTFAIRYRPSSISADDHRYMGTDGQPHNGIAQTITFPVHQRLGSDVVWTVGYNTAHSGRTPLGMASPTDSLNVGLSPSVSVGHDRFPGGIFWDTRDASQANGAPFVAGQLNLDKGWGGYVPAARFSVR